ncbi:MAG: histidinol-phosphate transaminase [Gammaproteobacteria bacterium]|nr:histidinol-phosphate transaminase [Gammaproteobacteria bacterium]
MNQQSRNAHPGELAVAAVRALSPYIPGKPISELERELGIRDIIKLASNENPYGPAPEALAAMRAALDEVELYPDGSSHELHLALARHVGFPPECLTVGNGSNDLLALLAESFLTPAHSAVYSQYGFAIYPLVIGATGARCVVAPAQPPDAAMPYGHDLEALVRAVRADTRVVFIANPNNPTGTWEGAATLRRCIERLPSHVLVVLDEAYFEYGCCRDCADGLKWIEAFPNLVVLRTFSKAYGLAGVRVGYAVSHPEVADVLNRLRPAFNVNSLAQAGARAALEHPAHAARAVAATMAELPRVMRGLAALGLTVTPSAANFVLAQIGPRAAAIYQQLLQGGVIVRPVGGYGLPEHVRITIGRPEQNDRLLALLARCLEGSR